MFAVMAKACLRTVALGYFASLSVAFPIIATTIFMATEAQALHVLFPRNPLHPKAADDPYQPEFLALQEQDGVVCSLIGLNTLKRTGTCKTVVGQGETVLYRGWMMTPDEYKNLIGNVIRRVGAQPVTSTEDYVKCHHLPGWYNACAHLTAETVFVPNQEDVTEAATALGWDKFFVKDYVKSNAGNPLGSIAVSAEEIHAIVDEFASFQEGGQLQGGISLRKVETYRPDSERRYFVVRQKVLGPDDSAVPSIVQEVAELIDAPFYSVDVAQTMKGQWRVVELGDGQVSSRKEWELDRFVRMLKEIKPCQ